MASTAVIAIAIFLKPASVRVALPAARRSCSGVNPVFSLPNPIATITSAVASEPAGIRVTSSFFPVAPTATRLIQRLRH